jgi:hypothetical protein
LILNECLKVLRGEAVTLAHLAVGDVDVTKTARLNMGHQGFNRHVELCRRLFRGE